MTKHQLLVDPRTVTGRHVKGLRGSGILPASLYGKGVESLNLQINSKEFQKLRREVGESTLLYLTVKGDSAEHPVLIREVVNHPVSGDILHVSFQQVNLKEKVTVPVPVEVVGEAPAESQKLGILVQQLDEIEVEALPTDIPENIQIDVSSLAEVGAAITVSDLTLNREKLTLKTPADSILVKIEPLAKEEVVETVAAPVEGTAPVEGEATEAATPAVEEKKED